MVAVAHSVRSVLLVGAVMVFLSALATPAQAQSIWAVSALYADSSCRELISYEASPLTSCGSRSPTGSCVANNPGFKKEYCGSTPDGASGAITESFNTSSCAPASLYRRNFAANGCFSGGIAFIKNSCSGNTFSSEVCPGSCGSGCQGNPFSPAVPADGVCKLITGSTINYSKVRCGNASSASSVVPLVALLVSSFGLIVLLL